MKLVLEFENVSKIFPGDVPVNALTEISLKLTEGCFAALVGASGSGKSTFLNIASGLDNPTSGVVQIAGTDISKFNERRLSIFRREHLGFVFQAYNLFPTLTAIENVEYTMLLRGEKSAVARQRATESLRSVGLEEKAKVYPQKLSGGQQQRVAVARALASRPDIIFADEPTANLDSDTAAKLIELFRDLNKQYGTSFLFSTHDRELIQSVKTVINIRSGQITSIATAEAVR
jgi:putative ABC transport system ATP-binding protein